MTDQFDIKTDLCIVLHHSTTEGVLVNNQSQFNNLNI